MDVDRLIEESIDALADDNPTHGAECLVDLAKAFAVTGMGQDSFNNIRYYIIEKAKERDQCPGLIDIKLKLAEQKLQEARNGEPTRIYTGT